MKKFLVLFFLSLPVFFSFKVFSQKQQYLGGNFTGSVSGIIVDGATMSPLEYVSVALLKRKDSTIVNGVLSDSKGSFNITTSTPGMFVLKYSFVGYKSGFVDSILVTPRKPNINLGNVVIKTTAQNIAAVVVRGNAPAIEYKIDKQVVDVSSNVVAAGGTVVDALQNTPSVQTDVEGNVTLRGNSNFTVLIDGKPSPVDGSEALQQIPASLVQSVEIITNPSAKYDAEGTAGIINVIMKKQKVSGMNGILNVTAGTNEKYSGNVNVNYKVNKFNFSLGTDLMDMKYAAKLFSNSVDSLSYKTLKNEVYNGNGGFHRKGVGIKGGIEYDFNDNNSLSLTGNIGKRDMTRGFNSNYSDNYSNQTNDIYYISNNNTQSNRNYFDVNLNYFLKLSPDGHQFSATVYYSAGPENQISNLLQDTTTINWASKGNKPFTLNTNQDYNKKELRTKADYSLPISENGKLGVGYEGTYRNNNDNYTVIRNDSLINNLGDVVIYKEQVQAGYITYSNSLWGIDYLLGLRGEYENRDFTLTQRDTSYKLNQFELFPSFHSSKQLPWGLQVQASYSRRIDRPRDWNLYPIPMYVSQQSIRVGNPNLPPDLSDSYELNLEKKINDASFISVQGFYKTSKNLMQWVNNYDSISKVTTTTFQNIDHDRSIGVEFMLNLAPVKWFNFNASSDIYNYSIYDERFVKGGSNNTNTWNFRINPTFRFPWGTTLQLFYNYNGPSISAQGTRSSFYSSNIGLRQDFLKHKGSLTLNIQNPIGITRYNSTSSSILNYSTGYFQRESHVYMLTFSYKINNYKTKQFKQTGPEDTNNSNNSDADMNGGM